MTSIVSHTWACDQCGNVNDTKTWPCEICLYPLVYEETRTRKKSKKSKSNRETALTQSLEQIPSQKTWECTRCKSYNPMEYIICSICFTNRNVGEKQKYKASATGMRLQQSMDNIFIPQSISTVEELKEEVPTKHDKWEKLTNTLSIGEHIRNDLTVRDVVGEHPKDTHIGGAIVLHGKNIQSVTGVLFRVLAPNAEKVAVTGEWDDWVHWDYLYKVAQGGYWETVVKEARPGCKYNYIIQYFDNKKNRPITQFRADPRGEILHYTRGRWMNEVYDHKRFRWTDSHHTPIDRSKMILYELHIGSFPQRGCSKEKYDADDVEFPSAIGTFNQVTEKLDYLLELGVNTLALLPITQDSHMKPYNCWGYDPVSLWAVHRDYGTPDDLKNLINTAHGLGISVLFDFVPNHLSSKNVLNYFDGPEDIYFPKEDVLKTTDWGPRLNFSSQTARDYIIEAAESWLRDFHFDGIRVDSTCNIRGYSDHGHLQINPDGWILLQELTDMVRVKYPKCISIAEDLQDHHAMLNCGGAGFDSQWDDVFFKAILQSVVTVSDKHRNLQLLAKAIQPSSFASCEASGRIIFTENHDTVPEDRQGRIPAAILRGNQPNWPDCSQVERNYYSLKRTALALSILMTSPGIPMFLQGQEMFETCAPCWPFGPIVDFSREYRMEPPGGFHRLCQDLCKLRKDEIGITTGLTGNFVRVYHLNEKNNNRLIIYHRWSQGGPTDDVVVIINCCNIHFNEYWLGFPRHGTWKLRFNSDSKLYSSAFCGVDHLDNVETKKAPKDGYPFSGCVTIAPYTALIYSQDVCSTVQFRLRYFPEDGDSLWVVGSIPALGSWKLKNALKLETGVYIDNYQYAVSTPVMVTHNQLFEFKFVLKKEIHGNEIIYWQKGENHIFSADSVDKNYQVDCLNVEFENPN